MKNAIREYLPLSDARKQEIWKNGVFVFDTNVLLNLYRYTRKTCEALIDAMEKYQDHIWIPYHVAHEFMERRLDVIYETNHNSEEIAKTKTQLINDIKSKFRLGSDNEDLNQLEKNIADCIEKQEKENIMVHDHKNDEVLDHLLKIFDGKTGQRYSNEQYKELEQEGEERYKNNIPPGYKDKNKDGNPYGDFIIWKQIIDYAKERDKDIIFVTDDKKEDWQYILHGKKIGIRHELRKEFYEETAKDILMYSAQQFIKHYSELESVSTEGSILKEIDSASKRYSIGNNNKNHSFDFSRAKFNGEDFHGADFRNHDLTFSDLSESNLSGANLHSANLSGALLGNANLNSANLYKTNLSDVYAYGADFSNTNLSEAFLAGANLSEADFSFSNLTFACFDYARLDGADLFLANLDKTDFENANLSGARLNCANLKSTNLNSADLSNADLSSADLMGGDFENTNLSHADLSYANLSHVDFSSTNLDGTDFLKATMSKDTYNTCDFSGARNVESIVIK